MQAEAQAAGVTSVAEYLRQLHRRQRARVDDDAIVLSMLSQPKVR
jgi:hypothetical protein